MSRSSSGLIVKAYQMIGDRSSCEDVIKVQAMRKKTDFVGLIDGHSGVEAANYAKDHLCRMMQEDEDIYNCDPVRCPMRLNPRLSRCTKTCGVLEVNYILV